MIYASHHNGLSTTTNNGLWAGGISPQSNEGVEIVSLVSSSNSSMVLLYDKTGTVGAMEDKTVVLSSTSNSTTEIYNSNDDALRVGVDVDSVKGIDISLASGAVLTGTPVITASYRSTSGELVSLEVTITGDWTTQAIVNLSHEEVLKENIGNYPVTGEPNADLGQFIDYRISGITTMTTPAVAEWLRVHIGDSTEKTYTRYTDLLQIDGNYPQSTQDLVVAPIKGDLTLFGVDYKTAKLFYEMYRGTNSTNAKTKRIYSTASGFEDLPVANVIASPTSTDLFNNQGSTTYQDDVFDELIDIINPPEDWAITAIVVDGVAYTKYWIGFEYTESALSAWAVTLFKVKTQSLHGDDVIGVPQLTPSTSYSEINMSAENGGMSKVLVSNTRTGETALVEIVGTSATEEISFVGQASTDDFLIQTLEDDGINSPSIVELKII